jgi:hypothetical protein
MIELVTIFRTGPEFSGKARLAKQKFVVFVRFVVILLTILLVQSTCYCARSMDSPVMRRKKPFYVRLYQNFSFWNSFLEYSGKTGLLPVFPGAWFKTNRVLEQAHVFIILELCRNLGF